ncbi:MAG: ABC transporter ATP-binding protein [Chloroflexi bacterium]|nr:ABC transporter ATP-binding protein [Chloroflexota bacterium]
MSRPATQEHTSPEPAGERAPRLRVSGVTKVYPGRRGEPDLHVLAGVDLEVDANEFVSIIGPSGCGKSTLLNVISGLEPASSGEVALDGDVGARRLGVVAYMHQRDLLLPWRTVLDNAALGLEIRGVKIEEARRQALALFPRFGLSGFESAYPEDLSGGMRQRVAFLRAMLPEQDLLLLDEPFGALDAITRSGLQEWLAGILRGANRSVLLVTHDVEEALLLSERVYVMSARPGRTVLTVTVGLPTTRTREIVTEPAFVDLKRRLLAALAAQIGEPR